MFDISKMLFDKLRNKKDCPRFVWVENENMHNFTVREYISCEMIGQSRHINYYPDNCLHIDEIKEYEKQKKRGNKMKIETIIYQSEKNSRKNINISLFSLNEIEIFKLILDNWKKSYLDNTDK